MLALAAALAGTVAGTARADGDPASDVLLSDNVFLSYQSPYGSPEGRARRAATVSGFALDEIRREAEALGPWFHNIDLGGVVTAPEHFLGDYPAVKWRRFGHALPADLRPTPRHLNTFKKGLT